MAEILVIANAAAGSAQDEAVDAVVAELRTEHEVQLEHSCEPGDLDRILTERADDPFPARTVVIVGGDGSIHAVVGALYARGDLDDVVVGIVPMGTGNDFARSLELSSEPTVSAKQILAGRSRPIDLIIDDDGLVIVNAVHLGLGADAGKAARPWKKFLGPAGYVVGGLISGFVSPGSRVSVTVDGRVVSAKRRLLQVAIGNGAYVGGGTELVPGADPGDGLLDVSIAYANTPGDRLSYALHLSKGDQGEREDVVQLTATEVTVSGDAFICSADGELQDPVSSRTWRVLPGALTLLLP